MSKRSYLYRALESGAVCVFPTEVAARSALVDYARVSSRGAIFSDRAISFDTFRAQFLPRSETLTPANALLRQLFVSTLSERGVELSHFFHPRYPETNRRLERTIASILPALSSLFAEEELLGQLPKSMTGDLSVLWQYYQHFLAAHQLFEPRYESYSLGESWDPSARYIILYSDTIAEAESLYTALGEPKEIELWPTPEVDLAPLALFPNHIQEVRSTIRAIAKQLRSGVQTHQIAIGCAPSDTLIPLLSDEAARYGIPLSVREGQSPLLYAGGNFFARINDLYEEHFSLESVKALLLDPSIPWLDSKRSRAFIARAVEQSIFSGSLYGSDAYVTNLRDTELVNWYLTLKRSVMGIAEARSITALRNALNFFQDTFFIEAGWLGSPGEEVYSFCLQSIEEIERALRISGQESHPRLYSWLLSHLRSKRYVFQEQQKGIAVYRWPQAATLLVDHLYILGLDDQSSRVLEHPFAFLGSEAESYSTDCSLAHYRAASLSLVSVNLSTHLGRYDGQYLPPAPFFESGALIEHTGALGLESDPFIAELARWRGESASAPLATESQRVAFERAELTTLAPRAQDFALNPVPPSLVDRLKREYDGVFAIPLSATRLDLFDRCPFAFFGRSLLGVEEGQWEPQRVNHLLIGALQHEVYQRFFTANPRLESGQDERYREEILSLFDTVLNQYFGERGPTPSIRAWMIGEHREQMSGILSEEERLFAGDTSVGFEEHFGYHNQGFYLNGLIDRRIARGDNSFAVVDYKKGTPAMRKLTEAPQSYQLLLYQDYVNSQLGSCSSAAYYSIKEQRYYALWNEAESLEAQLAATLFAQRLDSMQKALAAGELMATPSKRSCERCGFRALCRRRFAAP